ncbi:hypothetical protein PK28_07635 [Hymenobacter sp. DG25B]|jgi:hypothetical protein|uniref:hypothetical protein n=1 Tax=Hymenobacter sp. DG25B TaxID=1385664 RepID=UPI000540CC1C|nr:hypothetical protein [Hymenobacter sp. DG25B]AIZ63594.1 hypothetical protein PK28_07635 [Hymenobacter sp. DG25B]
MDNINLLSRIQLLGHALDKAADTADTGSNSALEQVRAFLFTHLLQEPVRPHRADDVLELLTPSPHNHLSWEQQQALALEGLAILRQVWLRTVPLSCST